MIPAINVNNAVKEGEERKESQQPLISSPKRPAPARSHVIPDLRGPCHDRNRDRRRHSPGCGLTVDGASRRSEERREHGNGTMFCSVSSCVAPV